MRAMAALLLMGCGVEVGYPHASAENWFEETEDLDAAGCAEEYEPNDNDAPGEYGALGLVSSDRSVSLCGDLSRLAHDSSSGTYTGDVDIYIFETLDAGRVRVALEWSGGSDVDLHLMDGTSDDAFSDYDGRFLSADLDPGFHSVQVSGASGAPVSYALWVSLQ